MLIVIDNDYDLDLFNLNSNTPNFSVPKVRTESSVEPPRATTRPTAIPPPREKQVTTTPEATSNPLGDFIEPSNPNVDSPRVETSALAPPAGARPLAPRDEIPSQDPPMGNGAQNRPLGQGQPSSPGQQDGRIQQNSGNFRDGILPQQGDGNDDNNINKGVNSPNNDKNSGSNSPNNPVVRDPPAVPILTVGSKTVTGNAAAQFSFAPGQILTPGDIVVLQGTTVSLAPLASFDRRGHPRIERARRNFRSTSPASPSPHQ